MTCTYRGLRRVQGRGWVEFVEWRCTMPAGIVVGGTHPRALCFAHAVPTYTGWSGRIII